MTESSREPSSGTLSRALYSPGPQPPLSHFGATLLRHVIGTVVRYSFYQLGLPMPESPPVRILRLRVFLDATPLEATLAGDPAGAEVLAALLRPGGAGELDPAAVRVRSAAALHRARLAALGPRRGRAAPEGSVEAAGFAAASGASTAAGVTVGRPSAGSATGAAGRARQGLWSEIGARLSARMPYLCDAALGELVTSLGRRRLRRVGRRVPVALGQVAWQVHRGRAADLGALGPLDPLEPSWAESGVPSEAMRARAARALGSARLPARSGRRGGFREAYRWVLSEVRPLLLELGAGARADGLLDEPEDLFFIPFDLGAELTAPRRPSWLAAAVAANRREHQMLSSEPEHDDEIEGPPSLAPLADRSGNWEIAPLLPLP